MLECIADILRDSGKYVDKVFTNLARGVQDRFLQHYLSDHKGIILNTDLNYHTNNAPIRRRLSTRNQISRFSLLLCNFE